jgi:hypothetical protein
MNARRWTGVSVRSGAKIAMCAAIPSTHRE